MYIRRKRRQGLVEAPIGRESAALSTRPSERHGKSLYIVCSYNDKLEKKESWTSMNTELAVTMTNWKRKSLEFQWILNQLALLISEIIKFKVRPFGLMEILNICSSLWFMCKSGSDWWYFWKFTYTLVLSLHFIDGEDLLSFVKVAS